MFSDWNFDGFRDANIKPAAGGYGEQLSDVCRLGASATDSI